MRLHRSKISWVRQYERIARRTRDAAALAVLASAVLGEDTYPAALVLAAAVCILGLQRWARTRTPRPLAAQCET